MLGFAALNGVLILAQILWSGWQSRRLDTFRPLHQPVAASVNHGRILWIVVDEPSYRQIYEHRYPGLKLPAFDRLAAVATVFTRTVPAGNFTEVVLPSLMTGQPLDKMGAPAAGFPLLVRNASTGAWQPFAPRQTVFQDALNAGYETAAAGWYNPYCRILSEVLDQCFWTNHGEARGAMHSGQSAIWNMENPVLQMMPWHSSPDQSIVFHQLDYRELPCRRRQAARGWVRNVCPAAHSHSTHAGHLQSANRKLHRHEHKLPRQPGPVRRICGACQERAGGQWYRGRHYTRSHGRPLLANIEEFRHGSGRTSSLGWRAIRRSSGLHRQASPPEYSRADRNPICRAPHPRPVR